MGSLAAVWMGDRGGERIQVFGSGRYGTGDQMAKTWYKLSKGVFAARIEFGGQKSK
jgi:hypothetical protein